MSKITRCVRKPINSWISKQVSHTKAVDCFSVCLEWLEQQPVATSCFWESSWTSGQKGLLPWSKRQWIVILVTLEFILTLSQLATVAHALILFVSHMYSVLLFSQVLQSSTLSNFRLKNISQLRTPNYLPWCSHLWSPTVSAPAAWILFSTAFIKLHSKDSHTIVVTKFFAKITHLLLQWAQRGSSYWKIR